MSCGLAFVKVIHPVDDYDIAFLQMIIYIRKYRVGLEVYNLKKSTQISHHQLLVRSPPFFINCPGNLFLRLFYVLRSQKHLDYGHPAPAGLFLKFMVFFPINPSHYLDFTFLEHFEQERVTILSVDIDKITTYNKDGRASLGELYRKYELLHRKFGWERKQVYSQELTLNKRILIPIFSFRSPNKGPSIWIFSGVHGEESAGPNAIAQTINYLATLAKKGKSIVLFPLLNPSGYVRNWRYQNEYRDSKKGVSVSDSEFFLPDLKVPDKPRATKPSCRQVEKLVKYILALAEDYKPILSLDLHEDEDLSSSYIYSQGRLGVKDPIAGKIVSILTSSQIPVFKGGKTRFGEKIESGVIVNINDGSLDEFMAAKKIIIDGKVQKGPGASTAIVVETPTIGIPLKKRIMAHRAILSSLEEFT